MSLCAGRMEELKGDLIRDERKVVTPGSPHFFQTFARNRDAFKWLQSYSPRGSAIFMAECPQPKLIL